MWCEITLSLREREWYTHLIKLERSENTMSNDALIRFEEDNYDRLAEEFININYDKWHQFVMEEFVQYQADREIEER